MTKRQTAIEWLIEELGEYFPNEIGGIHLMVAKAKEMEKKQLSKSYHKGVRHEWEGAGGNFQDYYEETYGNETSI
jgi:hypothetical protein